MISLTKLNKNLAQSFRDKIKIKLTRSNKKTRPTKLKILMPERKRRKKTIKNAKKYYFSYKK